MGFAAPKISVKLALLHIIGSIFKVVIKYKWASLVGSVVKSSPAIQEMQEMSVQSWG